MAFDLACACGQKFRAEDALAGVEVPCPSCGKAMQRLEEKAASALESVQRAPQAQPLRPAQQEPPEVVPLSPAAEIPAARNSPGVSFEVACQCGARFLAESRLQGSRLPCPNCQRALLIERAAARPAPSNTEPLWEETGLSADPAADPLTLEPLAAVPRPTKLGDLSPPTASKPLHVIGIVGAGCLALILMGGGLIWLLRDRDDKTVAAGPDSSQTNSPATAPPAASGTNTTANLESSATNPSAAPSPNAPSPNTSPPNATTSGGYRRTPSVGPDNGPAPETDSTASGKEGTTHTADVPDAADVPENPFAPKEGQRTRPRLPRDSLDVATQQWLESGKPLAGVRRVADEDLVIAQFSWLTSLLPYLGYEEYYQRLDFDKSWSDRPNLIVAAQTVPQFLNPLDPRARWEGYPYDKVALTHYVGISGVEDDRHTLAAELSRTDPRAGVFGYDEVAKPSQITDGQSQTMMLITSGEMVGPWIQGGGATVRGARQPYLDPLTGFGYEQDGKRQAMALMADGSTRVIPLEIDAKVFRAMCTIAGGENVDLQSLKPAARLLTRSP